jgi:vancomycin resistance protein YoaR
MAALILLGVYFTYQRKYLDRYFPGSKVAGIEIGGLDKPEAEKRVNAAIDDFFKSGLIFKHYKHEAKLALLPESTDAALVFPPVAIDADEAFALAYDFPRQGNFWSRLKARMSLWSNGRDFSVTGEQNEAGIKGFLEENFGQYSLPAHDASLILSTSTKDKTIDFRLSDEVKGEIIDIEKAIDEVQKRVLALDKSPIFLEVKQETPAILRADIEGADQKAEEMIGLAPIGLTYQKKAWEISADSLAPLLKLKQADNQESREAYVGLDCALFSDYLGEKIAKAIDQPAIDPKFEVINGKVQKFQTSQDGLELDRADACRRLEEQLRAANKEKIELVTKLVKSAEDNMEIDSFGLREILGTGHSNFAGSSNSRRHNIKIGADSVNGTLLAPGEEFSLLKVLGDIDAKSGYLPELVIKEGRTLPEYGGGLCQIGTTVFRGTVDSGLPVTMRRNHSYRVSYYEPAGTDATIYDPWPDYKFKNDTAHHILIQSRMNGNDLYFDFWGTPDGRQATNTYPVIYNIKKPGPTKLIETTTLKPGQKKCTESAHNGADAYFDYKVIYPDGRVEDTRFKSHYVPWQAVCLIGVDKLTKDKEAEAKAASSTPAVKTD